MSWFAFLLLLFGLSWSFIGIYRWYAINKGIMDHPSARSSHFTPTARGGGVIFSYGWSLLLLVLHYYHIIDQSYLWLLPSILLITTVGFIEDRKGLSSITRLIFHFISAVLGLYCMNEIGDLVLNWLPFQLPLFACFSILVLGIVWMINLFNFMDGSDGLAAMQGMFVFGIGGYFLFQYQAYELATLSFALVALLTGFLAWNWPTARIFMGDSGSYFLGFTISLFALLAAKYYQMPLAFWFILTGLFWFDATITLLRRIIARENWYKPHRTHAYQRLIQSGWSHQKVLLCATAANAVLGGLAMVAYKDPRLLVFSSGVAFAFLLCLYILVEIRRPMYKTWYEA